MRNVLIGTGSADTSRLRSPMLWKLCPSKADFDNHNVDGIFDGDDFQVTTDEDENDIGGYERYIDTSNTIRPLAVDTTALATGSRGGVLRISTDASDNDGPAIQRGSANNVGNYLIGNTAGAAWPMWFEARVRKSSVTDNQAAIFVGLAEANSAADDGILVDDTGALVAERALFGFRVKHDNGEELDFAYGGTDAGDVDTEVLANMASLTAGTWFKVGFFYNPFAAAANKITLFYNGVPQSTYITTTNIDASTFPENTAMMPAFCVKNGEATAVTFDIDWWYIAQVYDDNFRAK